MTITRKFQVIPAIDLMDGKCVRLIRGELEQRIEYSVSPIEMAERYMSNGAKLIHVVDLDGAFSGNMTNLPIISKLAIQYPIQVGGGVRDEEWVERLLEAGVQKVILGTILLKDRELATMLKTRYAGKIVGSFDFKDGLLAYSGWTKQSDMRFDDVVAGLDEIVVTDTGRDGTLSGPNLRLLSWIRTQYPDLRIISAGGVRDTGDLDALIRIGIDGTIIGRGFFENKIPMNAINWRIDEKSGGRLL